MRRFLAVTAVLLGVLHPAAAPRAESSGCLSPVIGQLQIRPLVELRLTPSDTPVLGGVDRKVETPAVPAPAPPSTLPLDKSLRSVPSSASPRNSDLVFNPRHDAYRAGPNSLHAHIRPAEYGIVVPDILQADSSQVPATLTISDHSPLERLAPYLPEGDSGARVTQVGKGATARTFVVHEPSYESDFETRKRWALSQALEVIKVKLRNVFTNGTFAEAARYFRTDLIRYELARQLVPGLTYRGRQLLEVARITSTVQEHAVGIVRQEPVKGPSVYEIQFHLDRVMLHHKGVKAVQLEQSIAFLVRHRLVRKGTPLRDQYAEIQREIDTIVNFYRDTHNAVAAYGEANGLGTYVGKTREHKEVFVGFDFNHGSNVHVEVAEDGTRTYKMIDF